MAINEENVEGEGSGWHNCPESRLQINCPVLSLTFHSCLPLRGLTLRQSLFRDRGNQFLPWLQVSFYLATSSSVCFSAYVSPSAFLLLELYDACRPSSLFSFMNLFPLVLLCLYSVISGKNRTCMHVLSPSFGTWRQLSHFCIPLTLCLWVRHWRAWSKRMASISIKFLLFSWNAL